MQIFIGLIMKYSEFTPDEKLVEQTQLVKEGRGHEKAPSAFQLRSCEGFCDETTLQLGSFENSYSVHPSAEVNLMQTRYTNIQGMKG